MTRDGSKTTLVAKKTIWWNLANLENPSVSRMHVFSLHPVSGGVDPIINHMMFTNVPMAKSHEILSKPASLQAATAKKHHITTSCGSNKNTPTNHYTGCITQKNSTNHASLQKKRLRTNIPTNLTTNLHQFQDQHKNIHTKELQKTTSSTSQSGSQKTSY